MRSTLDPIWVGLLHVAALLYAAWASTAFFSDVAGQDRGMAIMTFGIHTAIVFVLAFVACGFILVQVLSRAESNVVRSSVVGLLFLVFWFGHGMPSMLLLVTSVTIFAFGYWHGGRLKEDEDELANF